MTQGYNYVMVYWSLLKLFPKINAVMQTNPSSV